MAGEWTEKTIGKAPIHIGDGNYSAKYPKSSDFVSAGVPFITASDMSGGHIRPDNFRFISKHQHDELRKGHLCKGDVVVVTRGNGIGNVAFVDPEFHDANINAQLVLLRADEKELHNRFLYFMLSSKEYNELLIRYGSGSAQPQIPVGSLVKVPLHYPGYDEQRGIAHILGTLDDKIELNRRMNETLEAVARALFKSWFVDFLPVRAKMAAKANDPSLLLPQAEPNTWYVYAIECNDGSLYVGQTEDLRQRWLQHVGGKGASWTKTHPPVRVPYWERQPSREAAVERENWLKTGYGRKWLKQEIAARTQTGDPLPAPQSEAARQAGVRSKAEGRDTRLPQPLADLFPDSFADSELGEIPKGWEVGPLDSVLVLQRGFDLPATQRTSGAYSVLAASGPSGTHNEFMVRGPGVTTGRSGVLGKVFYVDDDFWPLNTSLWVKEFRHSRPAYAFHLLRGLDFALFNAGSAVPTLNRNHVHTLPTLIPPMGLIDAFERVAISSLTLQKHNDHQSKTLSALRDVLLPKLISGELRVPDAEPFIAEVAS
jgi:restriction endonuclease S subunit